MNFSGEECKHDNNDDYMYYYIVKSVNKGINDSLPCLAYVNGYAIYSPTQGYTTSMTIYCDDYDSLEYFVKYLKNLYKSLNYVKDDGNLQIHEYNVNGHTDVGQVNVNLTMENYVSRHKKFIISKLDAFKNNKLFEHPFIENNLGVLLHGNYGTGKSFLISAFANYLNRHILVINFAKIRTKTQFRQYFTHENNKNYVYCLDEFDYLLTDLLNNEKHIEDRKLKIELLSKQLSMTKDNKDVAEKLINELKQLMENNEDDKMTYEFFLSELSGLSSTSGRCMIATTNFLDKIPDALKRPGRFDIILNLSFFNKMEIVEMLKKLYPRSNHNNLDTYNFKENTFTPSQLVHMRGMYDNLEDMVKELI